MVIAAELVSTKILSPARAVYADVFSIQVEEPVCKSNQLVPSVATLLLLNGNKVIVLPLAPSLKVYVHVVLALNNIYSFCVAGNCTMCEASPLFVNLKQACLAWLSPCVCGPSPVERVVVPVPDVAIDKTPAIACSIEATPVASLEPKLLLVVVPQEPACSQEPISSIFNLFEYDDAIRRHSKFQMFLWSLRQTNFRLYYQTHHCM